MINIKNEEVKILLVDDSSTDVEIILNAFKRLNLPTNIKVVNDGEEAVLYLKKEGKYKSAETPGLILLDINMPKKNGFQVLSEIKADEVLNHIPIVMLTTSNRNEDVLRAYKNGISSYIVKPLSMQDMLTTVKEFSQYWTMVSIIPAG